jgi:hypothetical protein
MRLFRIYFPITIVFFFQISFAQNYQDLYVLYENNRMERLQLRLAEYEKKYPESLEVQFFNALFLNNGDEAFKIYNDLFGRSDGKLKSLLAEKISEYYFAQGYYVKAKEYQALAGKEFPEKTKDLPADTDNKEVDSNSSAESTSYVIQVGAFSVIENANDLAGVLQHKEVSARVVARKIGDKSLYCVWVDGADDYSSTKEIAEEIKKKYNLSYRILKP